MDWDVVLLILTVCGLSVRKSRIQLQRHGGSPSADNLLPSICGMMVLKAELKSRKSSLT